MKYPVAKSKKTKKYWLKVPGRPFVPRKEIAIQELNRIKKIRNIPNSRLREFAKENPSRLINLMPLTKDRMITKKTLNISKTARIPRQKTSTVIAKSFLLSIP